jgi:hypothetical protein
MDGIMTIQLVSGVLTVIVLAVIVMRRRRKAIE